MKTKNFLLTGALLIVALFSVKSVMAQEPSTSDQVVLNLKFKPVQSITVATNQKTIDFVYANQDNYDIGVTKAPQEKHLKVFSSGGFDISVKADNENFTSTNTELIIPVSHITVKALKNAGNTKETYTFTPKALSATAQTIISSTGGGRNLEFDVEYDNTMDVNNEDYFALGYNKNYLTDDATVFTTNLTYTITTN